jgi:hypothetical protein
VDISGVVKTNADGEKYIEATSVVQNGTGSIEPVAMSNKALGGGDFLLSFPPKSGQQGVKNGVGLNNIGLLVTIWGTVTEIENANPATWFKIDDGSGVGVKVVVPSGVNIDPAWQYVSVTGISSCEKVGGELHRLLRVRQQSDIVAIQ